MEFTAKIRTNFIVVFAAVVLFCASTNAQRRAPSSPPAPPADLTPTPAPAPSPEFANLTYLLSYAGPFHTFLGLLQSTKVLDTFQSQANNTEPGITIFVPKDEAFTTLKKPSLANLTHDQLRSLVLFHAISKYYPLSEFGSLSQRNPIQTSAGNSYTLNVTQNTGGVIRVNTGWTSTKVISSVHAAVPLALYEIDKVLLPKAIFGTNIPPPPPPAPAPAPSIAPGAADAPEGDRNATGRGSSTRPGASAAVDGAGKLGCIVAWAVVMLSWNYL